MKRNCFRRAKNKTKPTTRIFILPFDHETITDVMTTLKKSREAAARHSTALASGRNVPKCSQRRRRKRLGVHLFGMSSRSFMQPRAISMSSFIFRRHLAHSCPTGPGFKSRPAPAVRRLGLTGDSTILGAHHRVLFFGTEVDGSNMVNIYRRLFRQLCSLNFRKETTNFV